MICHAPAPAATSNNILVMKIEIIVINVITVITVASKTVALAPTPHHCDSANAVSDRHCPPPPITTHHPPPTNQPTNQPTHTQMHAGARAQSDTHKLTVVTHTRSRALSSIDCPHPSPACAASDGIYPRSRSTQPQASSLSLRRPQTERSTGHCSCRCAALRWV